MSSNRSQYDGFAAVEAILIVVIVAIVGFTGWFVIAARRNVDKSLTASSSSTPVIKKAKTSTTKTDATTQSTDPTTDSTTTSQYINGATFELDKSVGDILQWAGTSEISNLSSSTLLAKEKSVYGDQTLDCTANEYPLGRVSVQDQSSPYPDFTLVKKLPSGKYLFYEDDGMTSSCYSDRTQLQAMITQQIGLLKAALKQAN